MNLHDLAPAPGSTRPRRRLGRGHGSGRVKTAGKGSKGQNARSGKSTKLFFEGGQNPWTMRIPHKRGFSRRRFKVERGAYTMMSRMDVKSLSIRCKVL